MKKNGEEEEIRVKVEETYIIESIENFSYLRSENTVDCERKRELEKRTNAGNRSINALCNILRDKNITRKRYTLQ